MKIVDTIRDFFAPSEDDSYESDSAREREDRSESRYERERKPVEREYTRETRTETRETAAPRGGSEYGTQQRGKVVNIQATAQLQVVLVKPEVFTDAKQIADHLIAKKTVVLNLETASAENKRRIIDFLVGVAYANGGSLKPVANLTYIITPYNVGFIGEDLVSELETNGVIM
ncbi:MAG: cell division protein SepF [Oscillospiraceae bacterium]|nr:cell division protein SepF [Oscillospiraceae bacterium]